MVQGGELRAPEAGGRARAFPGFDWAPDLVVGKVGWGTLAHARIHGPVEPPRQAEAVDEADGAALRGHGFSDDDIWDMAAIAAFFGMSNRLVNFASLRPNDEFYALGRG